MRSIFSAILLSLLFSACDSSGAEIVLLEKEKPKSSPPSTTPPTVILPYLNVSVASITPPTSTSSWKVVFRYEYFRYWLYPFLSVATNYQFGQTYLSNIKLLDFNSRLVFFDEFTDSASAEPFIRYTIVITACQVNSGDWFDGFSMPVGTTYFGSVPSWWLHVPVSTQHPLGIRNLTATIPAADPTYQITKTITIWNWSTITVQ